MPGQARLQNYTASPDQTCSMQDIFSGPGRRKVAVLFAWQADHLVVLGLLARPGLKYNFLVTPLSKVSLICFSPLVVQ